MIGAGFPDVPILLQVKADDRARRPQFSTEKEGSLWFVLKDVSHLPLIWMMGLLLWIFLPMPSLASFSVLALTLGVASHWIIDAFTHCGPEFKRTDQSLLWPLYLAVPSMSKPGSIPKLGYLIGRTGFGWEYRYAYMKGDEEYRNRVKTKKPERWFQVMMASLCLLFSCSSCFFGKFNFKFVAHVLEGLDLLIVFLFLAGYFVPSRFKKLRFAHVCLTWSVLIAQVSCGFRCPLLIYANQLRVAHGQAGIRVDFQPTFTNFVSSVTTPEFANYGMLTSILLGPFLATLMYVRFVRR